jgi:hypothetical protein
MTEGLDYAETFIGECTVGRCSRPATVRFHDDFVLCALHHLRREVGEDVDEAALALDMIGGWHSMADTHHNGYLIRMLDVASEDLRDRLGEAERRAVQLDRVDLESVPHGEPEG